MAHSRKFVDKLRLRFYNVNVGVKIILPFVALALFISVFGGLATSTWITNILDNSAKDLTHSSTIATEKTFSLYKNRMRTYTEHLAVTTDLPPALRSGDANAIRRLLLPQDIAADTDFLEVLDIQKHVIFSSSGPYAVGSDLGWLSLVQNDATDQTTVDILNSPLGYVFACATPVFDNGGLAGYIISGYFANGAFLNRMKITSNLDISLYSNKKLITTTYKRTWATGCSAQGCHQEGLAGVVTQKTNFVNIAPTTVNMLGGLFMVDHGSVSIGLDKSILITVLYPMDSIVRVQNIARGIIFILAATLMILITTFGYLIGKGIATPLRELSSISKRVSRGDLTPRMEYPGTRDEIGELSQSFNRMTESLQRYTSNLRKRLLELSILYEISVSARDVYDLDDLLELILKSTAHALNADCGSLLLLDDTGKMLIVKAGYNIPTDMVGSKLAVVVETGEYIWLGRDPKDRSDDLKASLKKVCVAGACLQNNTALLLDRKSEDQKIRDLLFSTGSSSMLSIPLRTNDKILGVMNLGRGEAKAPFVEKDRIFSITMASQSSAYLDNRVLLETLRESYISTVRSLAEAIDAKDHYTRGHSTRVTKYAIAIARELKLSEDDIEGIETAASLHDVGKIGISDLILMKPGKLTADEMAEVRSHPTIAAKILAPIKFPQEIAPIIFQHHERYDGGGYPSKLSFEEINIGARILAVADSYEAMTSERPYRAALSQQTAIEELKKGSGTQFDPIIVEAFLKVLDRGIDKELAAV